MKRSSELRLRNQALGRKLKVDVPPNATWPVLTRYDDEHLAKLAMPIGGIGTGTISLGGRGDLRDWELVNKPAKGYTPINTHFALWCKPEGAKDAVTRAIEGPIDVALYEGASGAVAKNHGLPRFRRCNFAAAYPLGQVLLSDPDVPLQVRIEAFNPLIPADADSSGIPIAILRFVLINPTTSRISASVCGTLENFIGWDGDSGKVNKNVNEFRDTGARGLFMRSTGLDPKHPAWGTLALATTAIRDISHRTTWADLSWGDSLLDFWDDLSTDGRLDPRESKREAPFGSLAASVEIAPSSVSDVSFLIAWHFPNRVSWEPKEPIGNYYTTKFADAWDVVAKTSPRLKDLEDQTVKFVRAFCECDLPPIVKEAALFNLSTLRTQTAFRAADGNLYGWEGCNDHGGCCHGSCTHVWNYEQTTPFLFGELARSMRTVEFAHATSESGLQSFRVNLPVMQHATDWNKAAADGQMGTIMKLYRDWRLSGDEEFLKKLWPGAKRALQFAWIQGGWDADRDGVMEGAQHNTMDVEYYGPNVQMGAWYLGALRAAEEMARHLGDSKFADTCHDLFERGRHWIDSNLFNGEFYEHHVVPPKDEKDVAPGLRVGSGAIDLREPELQLGPACLVDALVGQYMAHLCGLGYLLDEYHVRTTLASILKYNWRDNFFGHFNHLRSFVLGDEQALLMATYPRDRRPKRPFPYCNEVMTGFEYTAAAGMIFEGDIEGGLKVIAAIRDRYDGHKRSPFDEAECGHHYARAMAAWSAVLVLTGFHYDGVEQSITFAAAKHESTWFWSNGYAWGTVMQKPWPDKSVDVTLTVLGGQLALRSFALSGKTLQRFEQPRLLLSDQPLQLHLTK
jgi:uncharacterized protein (DUF608 family)